MSKYREMSNIHLNQISNKYDKDNLYNQESNNIGEITNNTYNDNHTDRGLPMRSQYIIKKPIYDANDHLDFDLFDNNPSKLDVKYFDSFVQNDTGFADISTSMTKLSSQINPLVICSNVIDKLNNNLFYYLFELINENIYIINGIGLFNLFASLYLASNGITEIELKKFFDFPKKDILYDGLMKITQNFSPIDKIINIKNFMLIGNDVPYNPNYYESIKDFCILLRLDISNPIKESNKVNILVKKILGEDMKNPILAEYINNLQLMFLSMAVIHPVWSSSFDRIIKSMFYGTSENKQINYLYSIGKSYGYFENNDHQLLEIICAGNNLVMGFLLHKNKLITYIDNIKLHFYISHIKESILDEIKIPVFKQDLKLRFNSSLKNMGLNSVFIKILSKDFFPEGVVLQDIIQNVKIIVDNLSVKSNEQHNKGCITTRKFIADKPFIYYFRIPKTDTIILMGFYQ